MPKPDKERSSLKTNSAPQQPDALSAPAPRRMPPGLLLAALCLSLALAVIWSSGRGYLQVPFADVAGIIVSTTGIGPAAPEGIEELHLVVVRDIRLPRVLTAAIVGAGLALAGVIFQGILLNPLADPYTLGVSAGAAFGAALALVLNITLLGPWSVPACAFAGALLTLALVVYLASAAGGFSSHNLILAGIIVATMLSAGISFLKYIADEQVSVIIFWLMGSFASKTWIEAAVTLLLVVAGALVCIFFARDLNLMSLGNRSAAALGVDTFRVTLVLLITASLISAACVSVSGIIGFVGLLVPHMMRALTGPDNRILIPVSVVGGALLLVVSDTVTRTVLPQEVPIGVLTALLGGPVFCYLFKRRHMEAGGQ